jgi:hypothetical protein
VKVLSYYHAPSGSIVKRSVVADDYTPSLGDWIEGVADPETQYVSGGALATRTPATLTASATLVGVGSPVTVTCPDPCWLRVNGDFFQVTGGSRTVTPSEVGSIFVQLAGAHVGPDLTITVGDEIDMAFDADARWQAVRTATVAQIDTWLTNNVTNITQARAVLRMLILAIRRLTS